MSNLKEQIIAKINNIILQDEYSSLKNNFDYNIEDNNATLFIHASTHSKIELENLKQKISKELLLIPSLNKVDIVFVKHKKYNNVSIKDKKKLESIKKIVLVGSGKGGVGKSTVSIIIAENLTNIGYNVGVLDADIYGPSIPQILGINEKPQVYNNKIIPLSSRGVKVSSVGFFIKESTPLNWRGVLAAKATCNLLSLTNWGDLDYLIIDMPPGTGDISMTILNNYLLDGAVLVTTPQELSRGVVERTIKQYKKFEVPILSIVENMSYIITPNSLDKTKLFSGNSGLWLKNKYKIPFMYQLPIIPTISLNCDLGKKISNVINFPIEGVILNPIENQ